MNSAAWKLENITVLFPSCTSNSHCFQWGFSVMVSPYTIPIPQAFRGRQDAFNSCPALSWAAQSVTRSSCLRKAPCLAPRSVFGPILLQKHVEAGCNPWRWEKESKGAGCFMEFCGGGDANPVGGSPSVLSTAPAVCHAKNRASCVYVTPSEPEHI